MKRGFLLLINLKMNGEQPHCTILTRIELSSQGLIDIEKEVTKLVAKQGDLEKQVEKLREKMSKSDYKEKVPLKVQEQDAEKVRKEKVLSLMVFFFFMVGWCTLRELLLRLNSFLSHSSGRVKLNLKR